MMTKWGQALVRVSFWFTILLSPSLQAQLSYNQVWHYHPETGDSILHYTKVLYSISSPAEKDGGFGWNLMSGSDINGDGYDELMVGAPGITDATGPDGQIFAYQGGAYLGTKPGWTFRQFLVWNCT